VIDQCDHAGIRWSSWQMWLMAQAYPIRPKHQSTQSLYTLKGSSPVVTKRPSDLVAIGRSGHYAGIVGLLAVA
jgi:hypothetical protein